MEETGEIEGEEEVPTQDEVIEQPESPEADEKYGGCDLIKKRSKEIIASFSAACGAFAIGTVIGWTSPATPKLTDITDDQVAWIGSIMAIGAALTTFHTGYTLDHLGRRMTLMIQIIPFTTGWLLIAFGTKYIAMMYVGRLVLGFASGSMCMAAPVYISEITSPDIRGSLGTLFQLMLTIGILFVYVFGAFVSVVILSLICLAWPWINVITMFFLPESPYFLAKKKKLDAATKAILWFRPDGNPEQEFKGMQESLDVKEESIVVVMKSKSARKAAYTTFTLMFLQQVSGINVVMFYSVSVFEMAKTLLSGNNATIVLGVVQCCVTALAAAIVDKTGRRILLIISFAGMAVCQLLLGIYFHSLYASNAASWLPLMCINLYLVAFSIGAGPLPWTMLGELLPPGAKGAVSSVAVFLNWGMAFVVTRTFHPMNAAMGIAAPFWIYGVFCAAGVVLIFLWVPETKGKTLEQIQRDFEG